MLRSNAFVRVAAGAVQASSTQHVAQLTRSLHHLSLAQKLRPASGISQSLCRAFATKVAQRKPTTTKAKSARKTPTAAKSKASKARAKAKKPAAKKKKTPLRKRKVVKKVVKPKRKVPTEKQKLAAAKTKQRDELKKIKETALVAPKEKPASAWTVYISEKLSGTTGGITGAMKEASTSFKALNASELEHYNHTANQNKSANEKAYVAWVNSHTPEQIRLANNARALLKRRAAKAAPGTKRAGRGLSKIKDERQVKRAQTGYLTFATERRTSGDFKNIKLGDAAKLITDEWKALSAGEKKKYTDLQIADQERYQREYQSTYGHPTAGEITAARAAAA